MFFPTSDSALGRLIRLPLRLIPRSTVLRVISGPLRGMKWRVGSADHGCWLGIYERQKQLAMSRSLESGDVVYDVGANAGIYTLLFSKLVGETGSVYSFEPLPSNVSNVLFHLGENCISNVTLFAAAIAAHSGSSCFQIGSSNAIGTLSQANSSLRVATFSLDDLNQNHGLPVPDLVKIDVEGGESGVLVGASKLLALHRTILFVALHSKEQKRLCCEFLRRWEYSILDLNGVALEGDDFADDEIIATPASGWYKCVG